MLIKTAITAERRERTLCSAGIVGGGGAVFVAGRRFIQAGTIER